MRCLSVAFLCALAVQAQVYSPHVMRKGDVDTRTMSALANTICERAGAHTPRERAEAIWRFFLTDGRFVKPGFWYHIAGWAYEEPAGEVLDPVKLVNSYGFGLCYQVAPLLAAVWDAAGFEDARVWFLTGHTVAEVFYDGAYHYYDSDMMGYNAVGNGLPKRLPVASVHQIERDPRIILSKLLSPKAVNPALVEEPWYPGDVREAAIDGLAELFSTTQDNRLYPYTRYPQGHRMDFVLRPGERMIRYFRPEEQRLSYLPYKWDGAKWREFPQEFAQYQIRTEDGPHSQRDDRLWATGRLEYEPDLVFDSDGRAVVEVNCPYVIIDAAFTINDGVGIETSTDGGKTWDAASGNEPKVLATSEHGRLTAVSGTYGYLVRITRRNGAAVRDFKITTRFELNPRALPALAAGANEMLYQAGPPLRRSAIPVRLDRAAQVHNARWFEEGGQGFLVPATEAPGEATFEVARRGGAPLSGFEAGGRFLDIHDAEVPDKFTAEVRKTAARLPRAKPAATIEWSLAPEGPFRPLWSYDAGLRWRDGDAITRLLRWPEVDRSVRDLPAGSRKLYVRYRFAGMALDSVRLAAVEPQPSNAAKLEITHIWREAARERKHVQTIEQPDHDTAYTVQAGPDVTNEAIVLYCPRQRK